MKAAKDLILAYTIMGIYNLQEKQTHKGIADSKHTKETGRKVFKMEARRKD